MENEDKMLSIRMMYESSEAKSERTIRRLIIALITAIIIIFANNAIWLYAWMQYDYVSEEEQVVTVDGKDGVCFEPLAEEFGLSVRQVKNIVYKSERRLFAHI